MEPADLTYEDVLKLAEGQEDKPAPRAKKKAAPRKKTTAKKKA